MRIERIAGATSNMGERERRAAAGSAAAAGGAEPPSREIGTPGRALVAVETPEARSPREPRARHSAPFLAQLLANRMGVPQTRARRRALPADGSARYAAAGNLGCARRIGVTDRRSI